MAVQSLFLIVLLAGSSFAEELTITIYNRADLSGGVISELSSELVRIFRLAGLAVNLKAGDAHAAEASEMLYGNPLGRHNRDGMHCEARRDIALRIAAESPRGLSPAVLGISHPFSPSGLNVIVFNRRILEASQQRNLTHGSMLAHVIAHEIGHVLIRSQDHAVHGMMAAIWKEAEYHAIGRYAMHFSEEQSIKMRDSVRGAGCPKSSLDSSQAQ